MNVLRTTCNAAMLSLALVAYASAQDDWIEDARGCKVFNPLPKPNETIRWSGECENGFAHGQGTVEWFLDGAPNGTNAGLFHEGKQTGRGTVVHASGARYEGEFVDGRPHGVGTMTTGNGVRYEGDFVEGKFSGNGILTTPDGIRRRGQFVAGMFTYGTMSWPNGDTYTGQLRENKRSGHGLYTFANGARYEGEFLEGKFHGQGVLTRPNGEKVSGTFTDGKFADSASVASAPSAQSDNTDVLKQLVDAVAPRDLVTGQRSLNMESEQEELKRASHQAAQILGQQRSKGVAVNADLHMIGKLRAMLAKIAAVSHRPNIPWEVHLLEAKEVNAFTVGGGKIFFWRGAFGGLIDPNDENEIAAVMAHEAAHVTLRHIGKRQGMQIGRRLVSGSGAARDALYGASFTTIQEDEADRVGLLYMALAGFDPRAASRIWARAHQKYGSNPGNYTYDHSLNIDRLRKLSSLTPMAMQYFKGAGMQNPDYQQLRSKNALIGGVGNAGSNNGLLALLEMGLGVSLDNMQAKREQRSREAALQHPATQARLAAETTRILGFKTARNFGARGGTYAGQIQNVSNGVLRAAQLTISYYDASGRVLHRQLVSLPPMNLPRGGVTDWSGPLLNVPGTAKVGVAVTNAAISQ